MPHPHALPSQPAGTVFGRRPCDPLHPSVGTPWPTSWAGGQLVSLVGQSLKAFAKVKDIAGFTESANPSSVQHAEPANWPSRPLRIGLVHPGIWAGPIVDAHGTWETEWFAVPEQSADASACREFVLDALVRPQGTDGLEINLAENPGQDAAWFDWGFARPLSYPGVFPTRVDAARITLTTGRRDDAALVRTIIEAGALLCRHPARLSHADRMNGRRPYLGAQDVRGASGFSQFIRETAGLTRCMRSLAEGIDNTREGSSTRAASRVLGSCLATMPHWENESARIALMDTCASVTGDEPETMLRLAAVRLGMGQDDAGLDALERADRILRDNQIVSATSQAAFISAELEHGHPGPLTIGRLAAGLCMLVSTMPASQVAYFRDDLFEDMRFSSLLIGRDQDRRLLMQVIRMLESVRRAETFGLPAVSANVAEEARAPVTTAEATTAARRPRKARAAEPAKKTAKPAAKKPTARRKAA